MGALGPLQWLGIGLLLAYAGWLACFFGHVRPWLMGRVGRRLGLDVEEQLHGDEAGLYGPTGGQPSLGSQASVWLADMAVLLAGTVGVAALLFVPAFLVAESGALLPLEGRLTGRQLAIELPSAVSMRATQGSATLRVRVRNQGPTPEAACQLGVADYEARNGYLAGSSAFFELPTGASLEIELPLKAPRPPVGTHAFRVELECGQQRRLVRRASLRVDP